MASKLVRANSLEPNVQNFDDARLLRFATGGFDGVTKGYRNELSYSIEGSAFKINGGEYVLQGWQAVIDGAGVVIPIDNISGVQYYVVYLEVNLSVSENQRAEINVVYNTAYYPTIDQGDNLTSINTGIARRELYRFQASSGVISNVVTRFKVIEPGTVLKATEAVTLTGNIANGVEAVTQPISDKSKKPATTEFVHLIKEKLAEELMKKIDLLASPNSNTFNLNSIPNISEYKLLGFTIEATGRGVYNFVYKSFTGINPRSAYEVSSNTKGIGFVNGITTVPQNSSAEAGGIRIYNNVVSFAFRNSTSDQTITQDTRTKIVEVFGIKE